MPSGVKVDTHSIRRAKEALRRQRDKKIPEVLHRVGERTIEILRSFTGEKNDRGRRMHPGKWADRTGNLSRSYAYEVSRSGTTWRLTLLNTAPHAHLVEGLGGFFVVRGVADPGGPVSQALRQAVRELAPGWEVV